MNERRSTPQRRKASRLALKSLNIAVTLAFVALGAGFLTATRLADVPDPSPGVRLLLGASHLALAALLQIPGAAAGAALPIGLAVVWTSAWRFAVASGSAGALPAILTVALILLVACRRRLHRADVSAWRAMLDRYAETRETVR